MINHNLKKSKTEESENMKNSQRTPSSRQIKAGSNKEEITYKKSYTLSKEALAVVEKAKVEGETLNDFVSKAIVNLGKEKGFNLPIYFKRNEKLDYLLRVLSQYRFEVLTRNESSSVETVIETINEYNFQLTHQPISDLDKVVRKKIKKKDMNLSEDDLITVALAVEFGFA